MVASISTADGPQMKLNGGRFLPCAALPWIISGAEELLGPLSITRLKQLIRERIEAGGIIGTRSRVSSQCCRAANHLVHFGERIAAEGIGIFTWGKPACKGLHLVASLL